MKTNWLRTPKKWYPYVLLFSLLPPIVQGGYYLFIGSLYPLLIEFILMLPVIYFVFYRKKGIHKALKYWGILVFCYGFLRITLITLFQFDNGGIPSAVYYQVTPVYWIKSFGYLLLGLFLWIWRKQYYSVIA